MHGLDTSNVSSRVESSRAKWNLSPNRCHNFSLPPVDTCAWASDQQSGHVSHRRQCIRTDSLDMCVCSVVYTLSRKFSPFWLSKRYYIVQYRCKKTFSCRCDCQLICCHSVPLLWRFISSFTTCFRYFSLHFLL